MNIKKVVGISVSAIAAGIGIYKLATGGEPEKYSSKWFENASDELLKAEREVVRILLGSGTRNGK